MEDDAKKPLVVLMHGDREVSTKELARVLGVKSVHPCAPETAERHSGYMVGGTSPFGLRKPLPVYVEATILELPRIYINGGKRGFIVGLEPKELVRVLEPTPVRVAVSIKVARLRLCSGVASSSPAPREPVVRFPPLRGSPLHDGDLRGNAPRRLRRAVRQDHDEEIAGDDGDGAAGDLDAVARRGADGGRRRGPRPDRP